MFKRVDDVDNEEIEGFSYINYNGEEEFVVLSDRFPNVISIKDNTTEAVEIFVKDIPKLVNALEAAYSHLKEKEYSYARTYYYQHKTCEKCGKVKERMI